MNSLYDFFIMNKNNDNYFISPQAADLLIAAHDGDMALLYLYLCRNGCRNRDKAGLDLFMPKQRLNEAYERLEMCSLLPLPEENSVAPLSGSASGSGTSVSPVSGDLPEYPIDYVKTIAEKDNAFSALMNEAQLVIGRPLSTPDLVRLLGIYDHFNLPPEVMMELMNFVSDVYREKYAGRRRPTVRAFELEARKWIDLEISDFDSAEQYIRSYRDHHSQFGAVREAMGVVNRDFTDTELRYVENWLSWGFGADAIGLAYDKTVTNTSKRSGAYMNKILMNWHDQGLHSLREIQEKDRPSSRFAKGQAPEAANPIDIRTAIDQI